jgi:hypothetical protein
MVPYLGLALALEVDTRPMVEVVDHVIPGVVLVGIGTLTAATGRLPLAAGAVAFLAALWVVLTHIPLLIQGIDGRHELTSALWHSVPGLVLLGFVMAIGRRALRESPA